MKLSRRQLEKIILEAYGSSGSDVSDALGKIVSSQLEDDPEALGDMMEKDPGIMKSVGEYFKQNPDNIPAEVLSAAGEAIEDDAGGKKSNASMFETYLHESSRGKVIADIALQLIEEEPGLGGRDIARTVIEIFNLEHRFGPNQPGAEEEEVFRALDVLVDEDQVFFDTQEDAWYIMGSPEAMDAMAPLYEEVVSKSDIEDAVMGVLSDEGGAAGLDPIEDALEDLENDDDALPDSPIEDIISNVAGVKRHVDGDYVDTTKLEGKMMKITKRQLRRIIKEEKAKLLRESGWKNADGSPWTPPPKSGRAGRKGFDPNDINANMGTSFFLGDESGNLDVDGDLLDPAALRQLADALEQLLSGKIQTQGMVGFDID